MQQNRLIKHNHEQGRASHYQNKGQPKIYGKPIWNKCLEFFQKVAIVSDVFKVNGSSFRAIGDRESTLAQVKFCLSTISCCEIDDMSCLGILERYLNDSSYVLCRCDPPSLGGTCDTGQCR